MIVSAPTSTGKTEAAFLPIITRILDNSAPSVRVLYVGPLKALINDQFSRLDFLCEDLDIPVHRWHGDVTAAAKRRLMESPSGILLITPESLEALLMRKGIRARAVFRQLEYIVVDELHSYIGNERGAQLQSLLHRVDIIVDRLVPRIGLSATLSEPEIAAHFLRTEGGMPHEVIRDEGKGEIRAQLRVFCDQPERIDTGIEADQGSDEKDQSESESMSISAAAVEFLLRATTGQSNLIFCNQKSKVEELTDALSELSRKDNRLDEFYAHHGNLSKELREDVEGHLKRQDRPVTCVCTSTLEMGVDIGPIKSVIQIGPPSSVASLRQRVGRSGRRNEPSILRMVDTPTKATAKTHLVDRLYPSILRCSASIELMAEGWYEPPNNRALHLSTLIQQTMSAIVERGGASISYLHKLLIGGGPFSSVSKAQFVDLLKAMGQKELLTQMDDGTLLLGKRGERMAEHFSFYAAFQTPEEFQLIGDGKQIGTMPISVPLKIGDPLIFGGKRWQVQDVDEVRKTINLISSRGRRPPHFDSIGGLVHGAIRQRMFELLCRDDTPAFMDKAAAELLGDARKTFSEHKLRYRRIVPYGRETIVFHWGGDAEASTLCLLLARLGLKVSQGADYLSIDGDDSTVHRTLTTISTEPHPTAEELAIAVTIKAHEKHDWILPVDLLIAECANRDIELDGALRLARSLAESPIG